MISASELAVASNAYFSLKMAHLHQIPVTYQIVISSVLPLKFHYLMLLVIILDTHFWIKVCAFSNAPWKVIINKGSIKTPQITL